MSSYTAQIEFKRNGSTLPITSAEFTRSWDEGTIEWEIETPIPLDDIDTENDTYSLRIAVAGTQWYRFQDCVATDATVDESADDGGTTISGVQELYSDDLLYYCAPKTVVFVNQNWLNDVFGKWTIRDGILRSQNGNGRVGGRLLHSRLPGTEYEEGTLDFKVGQWSHHGIATYLANMLGFNIIITTPDIPLIDTFTISSGQSWFDAIKANFTMWGVNVLVLPNSSGSGRPTIYILDVINSDGGVTAVNTITIDPGSMDEISYTPADDGDDSDTIEHCVVVGRSTSTTFTELPDFTIQKIPKHEWTPNCIVSNEVPAGDVISRKEMGEYTGTFGLGDDQYQIVLIDRYRTTQELYRYYDSSGNEQNVIIRETHDTIDKEGALVHRVQTQHDYSKDLKPIGSTEREWIRTIMPGESSQRLVNVRNKHTSQEYYIKALNQSLTTEIVEELVIADDVKKESGNYRDNPNPFAYIKRLDRTRTFVDKSANTNQVVFPMTTKFRRSFIDRASSNLLLKRTLDYDVLSATGKMDSQILHNPKPDQSSSSGTPFRREYFNGTPVTLGDYACYRRSTTITHQDITTDEIAEALADRAFYRKHGDVREVTVTTSVPIPIGTLPLKVTLLPMEREVATSDDEEEADPVTKVVLSTGGSGGDEATDYFLKEITETFTMDSDDTSNAGITIEQELTLSTTL